MKKNEKYSKVDKMLHDKVTQRIIFVEKHNGEHLGVSMLIEGTLATFCDYLSWNISKQSL
jgi:hypothetical protein